MKIALIGNSHIAAVKLGWDMVKEDYPHLSPFFVAASKSRLDDLVADGNKLFAGNEDLSVELSVNGGSAEYDFSSVDASFLIGMGWSLSYYPDAAYSSAMRLAWVRESYQRTLSSRTFGKLKSVTKRPIFTIACPLLRRRPDEDLRAGLPYSIRIRETKEALCDHGVTIVSQPIETIENDRFTADPYGIGGYGLGGRRAVKARKGQDADVLFTPKTADDYSHMNARYGAAIIKAIDEALSSVRVTA